MNYRRLTPFFIVALLAIGVATYIFLRQPHSLPPTFTITTHRDLTSSGGGRVLDETYAFKNGVIESGTATFVDNAGGGCTKDCNNTEQCIVSDNAWVEVQSWPDHSCVSVFGPVPTKDTLESKIRAGELIPKQSAAAHNGYYYELIGS